MDAPYISGTSCVQQFCLKNVIMDSDKSYKNRIKIEYLQSKDIELLVMLFGAHIKLQPLLQQRIFSILNCPVISTNLDFT